MRNLDFSSLQGLLSTLLGLIVITLIGVGIRLIVMQKVQQRRERENRQINERLRTLIAAYKTLGGSFTGDLAVDPTHKRDLGHDEPPAGAGGEMAKDNDRARRMRDAVEAALSDIILLGTEDQVRLATGMAVELAAGRPVHTDELVVSLRDFIRRALDLEPVPTELVIPRQGPARVVAAAKGKNEGGGKGGGGGGAGGGMAAAGMGMGAGMNMGAGEHDGHR
ncbi:hypothetical protein CSC70_10705 [Pseudoxanthomonas kalamensis DSM 18571]|uniref:hypothetical protein n=1 Tax=Pseudoxanthomonas kalamensis TaxID=289483 RepID=UPI001390B113|nr:hypothetical protein [Pseudoxanthomonas kalamensis]KAF1709277.1 hypothetical protein CSC70_10705 [Pseudoxanthomonas kalamensis DSM 18571]